MDARPGRFAVCCSLAVLLTAALATASAPAPPSRPSGAGRVRDAAAGALPAARLLDSAAVLPAAAASQSGTAVERLAKLPLRFEPNHGQTDARVSFLSRGPGYTLFLSPLESTLVMMGPEDRGAAVRTTLLGASPAARLAGWARSPGRSAPTSETIRLAGRGG